MDYSSKKLTLKWFLLTVVLLGVLAVGAYVAFTLQPKEATILDEFAGWKTYTNTEYGYELKYPDTLYFIEPNVELGVNALSFYYKSDNKEGPLRVYVVKNSDIHIDESRVVGERAVGGINSKVEAVFTGDAYSHCERTYAPNGSVTFIFEDNCGQNKDLFDKILSTFNFTNSSDVSGWKTYKNDEYGFEIKYPGDWGYGPNVYRDPSFPVFCPPELIDTDLNGVGCKWRNSSGLSPKPTTDSPILMFVELPDYIPAKDNNHFVWKNSDGKIYMLILSNESFEDVYSKMISTFKFTK